MAVIRQGECKRCGSCCSACLFLKWNGEMAVCGIYERHLQYCKDYPEAPSVLHEKCGYSFIDILESQEIKI